MTVTPLRHSKLFQFLQNKNRAPQWQNPQSQLVFCRHYWCYLKGAAHPKIKSTVQFSLACSVLFINQDLFIFLTWLFMIIHRPCCERLTIDFCRATPANVQWVMCYYSVHKNNFISFAPQFGFQWVCLLKTCSVLYTTVQIRVGLILRCRWEEWTFKSQFLIKSSVSCILLWFESKCLMIWLAE